MSFILCSYYTLDTPYQQVCHDCLMTSLVDKEIKTDVRGVQSLGSWRANTSYKPTFIKKMLEAHKDSNIVFVDADAEVLSYPALFDNIPEECNIAVHILDRDTWYNKDMGGVKELLSGTLFVRNVPESHAIVDRWITSCKNHPLDWEQVVLQRILATSTIKIHELPVTYCYIKTLPNGKEPNIKEDNPVIVHNQCSRQYKNQIK